MILLILEHYCFLSLCLQRPHIVRQDKSPVSLSLNLDSIEVSRPTVERVEELRWDYARYLGLEASCRWSHCNAATSSRSSSSLCNLKLEIVSSFLSVAAPGPPVRSLVSRHFKKRGAVNNSLSSKSNCQLKPSSQTGIYLNNGHFHFTPHHQFPKNVLEYVNKNYDTKRNYRGQAGPNVSSTVAKNMYRRTKLTNGVIEADHADRNLTILPDFTFMPVHWSEVKSKLWTKQYFSSPEVHWENLFRCSWVVHFFSYVSSKIPVTGNPHRDAYSYLGPQYCPKSFADLEQF
ncbi:uncharacterized protein LOC142344969 [Convolutriloba macropyga]|uniref:uncharacterized protein LOC142344969 n=1 Tax=Convolutriloba macropyga TaxID=536237 RepID=UPI003F51C0D0